MVVVVLYGLALFYSLIPRRSAAYRMADSNTAVMERRSLTAMHRARAMTSPSSRALKDFFAMGGQCLGDCLAAHGALTDTANGERADRTALKPPVRARP